MATTTYENDGLVLDRASRAALSNLTIEVWDLRGEVTTALATATTDEDGSFSVSVDSSAFDPPPADATFKIFDGENELTNIAGDVTWKFTHSVTSTTLYVELVSDVRVDGLVADATTGPVGDAAVRLFRRQMTESGIEDTEVVSTHTNAKGRYRMRPSFNDGRVITLLAKAFDDGGELLGGSEVVCRPGSSITLDIIVGGKAWSGPSEVERLDQQLALELSSAGASLTTMSEEDARAMACALQADETQVVQLANAAALAATTGAARDAFYAMDRVGLAADLHVLVAARADMRLAAVQRAVARGVVAPFEDEGAAMQELSDALVTYAMSATSEPGRPALREVIGTCLDASVPGSLHAPFVTHLVNRTGSDVDFWQALEADSAFSAAAIDELKLSFQLAGILQGFIELQQQVASERVLGSHPTLRDVARISRADWVRNIEATGSPIPFPPHVPGDTEQEKIGHLADAIVAVLEASFPSDALRTALESSTALSGSGNTFLIHNTELDLLYGDIDDYVAAHGTAAFVGISEPEEQTKAINEAKSVQRVARCAPKPGWTKTLMEAGFFSATQISSVPLDELIEMFSLPFGGDENVILMKQTADANAASSQAAAFMIQQAKAIEPYVTKSAEELDPKPANIASLFGSTSFCSCEHCSSVYSPAAYFVDLLSMLDKGGNATASNPVNVLLRRRPDMQNIVLSCENTNTPLPFIDLVNEALEARVDPNGDTSTAPHTPLLTAEELRAAPRQVNHAAYDELRAAVYPTTLPFVRPLRVARSYLDHVGTSRLAMMRQFRRDSAPTQHHINLEQLGLSVEQGAIVAGSPLPSQPASTAIYAYYGFADEPSWLSERHKLPVLLGRLGITFDDLTDLIQTRFIANGDIVQFTTTANGCDIDEMTLTPATDDRFDRMHRLVRLKRALGWSYADLDVALHAVGSYAIMPPNNALTATHLDKLAAIERLRVELNAPVAVVCALSANIDTFGESSLYESLFIDRATLPSTTADDFKLTSDKGELENAETLTLDNVPAVVAAALGISSDDLARLRDALTLEQTAGSVDKLSLANLSALYRHVQLARRLGLQIEELLSLLPLAGSARDPFLTNDSTNAVAFVELVRQILASNFGVAQLSYLYQHKALTGRNPEPTIDKIDEVLGGVQSALQVLDEELAPPTLDDAGFVEYAGRFVDDDAIAHSLLLALDYSVDFEPLATDPDVVERAALYAEHLSMVDVSAALELFPANIPADTEAHRVAARNEVLAQLHANLGKTLREKAVARVIAASLEAEPEMIAQLLATKLEAVNTSGISLQAELVELANDAAAPENYRDSYVRVLKASTLVAALGIKLTDASVMFADFDNSGSAPVNIAQLAVSAPNDPAAAFADWPATVDTAAFVRLLKTGASALSEIVGATTIGAAATSIAAATGWSEEQVAAVMSTNGSVGFGLTIVDLRDGSQLMRVARVMQILNSLGASATAAFEWAQQPPSASQADTIVNAVRAHYKDDGWLEVAQGLNDPLREQQRDALVAHLVPRLAAQGVGSVNDLYAHLLIDVEMSSCMLTSRVKRAISSVQLFVQRILLNLERSDDADDDVPPKRVNAAQWRWRKNYRVWEANRKVFLYPENWIEPELRTDKSPFFKELESELRQDVLTEEAIAAALSNYLQKVDEISRLVPVAHLWEHAPASGPLPGDKETLHIVARTAAAPYRYFYRTMTPAREWTAWEHIDQEIPSEQMVLLLLEGRLHLCWPTFASGEEEPIPGLNNKYWRVTLQMSERQNNSWRAPLSTASALKVFHTSKQTHDVLMHVTSEPAIVLEISSHEQFAPVAKFTFRCGQVHVTSFNNSRTVPFEADPDYKTHQHDAIDAHHIGQRSIVSGNSLTIGTTALLEELNTNSSSMALVHAGDWLWISTDFFFSDDEHHYQVSPTPTSWSGLDDTDAPKKSWVGLKYVEKLINSGSNDAISGAVDPAYQRGVKPAFKFPAWAGVLSVPGLYRFSPLHHPFMCEFAAALRRGGSKGLLNLANQQRSMDDTAPGGSYFDSNFAPVVGIVDQPYPPQDVTFRNDDAMALYNWELFFHVPLLIATRLNQEQRHEDAQRWFHCLFDPTTDVDEPAPQRFWRCLPLRGSAIASANDMVKAMADPQAFPQLWATLKSQLAAWMRYPFEPHRIAQLRISAYQKTVVMKYIDNLLDWGDRLFRRDTLESLDEATQLYVLAADILGERPVMVPPIADTSATTFAQLRLKLSNTNAQDAAFENSFIAIENLTPAPYYAVQIDAADVSKSAGMLTFCAPQNSELLGYWDRVSDRLFKLRHCLDIRGQRRRLPLFQPPIDPALLVRARAAGVDFGSILDDLNAPPLRYRFSALVAKAHQLAGETRSFGAALLGALERKDAEALAALRNGQEVSVLNAIRSVKRQAIKEAQTVQQSLGKALEAVQARQRFYQTRTDGGVNSIAEEDSQLEAMAWAMKFQLTAQAVDMHAGIAGAAVPDISTGTTGVIATWGGSHLVSGLRALSSATQAASAIAGYEGNLAGIQAQRKRRHDDWGLQAEQAEKESERISADLLAAEIREQIAKADLKAHELQIANAKKVQTFLSSKRTNEELYGWMIGKLREVYFQAYKLAYDMAKRAERAYRTELAVTDPSIIQFGYWDSLRQGLLAGEQLALDLQRLDVAYTTADQREHELTKDISLARLDAAALLNLRFAADGKAEFELPEWLFDVDYPGHYLRRIKAIRLTLPAVAGPHTSVNCRLTQLSSRIRRETNTSAGYEYGGIEDARFSHRFGPSESICTSKGQADSGMFELNFNDLRYLPFEGSGVIGRFSIELDPNANTFDLSTLSDAVLHISYTARDGGDALKQTVKTTLSSSPDMPLSVERIFSLKHEFPEAWHAFTDEVVDGHHVLTFSLAGKLPYLLGTGARGVDSLHLSAQWAGVAPSGFPVKLKPSGFDGELAGTEDVGSPPGFDIDSAPSATMVQRDQLVNSEHVYTAVVVGDAESDDWQLRTDAPTLPNDIFLLLRAARGLATAGDPTTGGGI